MNYGQGHGKKRPQCVLVYIDDITKYIQSPQQHVADLDAVFSRLEASSLKVRILKTRLALPGFLVLRNSMSALGILPHPHWVEAITMMK